MQTLMQHIEITVLYHRIVNTTMMTIGSLEKAEALVSLNLIIQIIIVMVMMMHMVIMSTVIKDMRIRQEAHEFPLMIDSHMKENKRTTENIGIDIQCHH